MNHVAAVIGVGFVGRAHVDAIRRLGIPIRGILASSKERGEESRKALGLERAYASLDELAADSTVTAFGFFAIVALVVLASATASTSSRPTPHSARCAGSPIRARNSCFPLVPSITMGMPALMFPELVFA